MIIYLNGTPFSIEEGSSLHSFLVQRGYTESYYAVAINRVFISRERYAERMLKDQDQIDVVAPMQGG